MHLRRNLGDVIRLNSEGERTGLIDLSGGSQARTYSVGELDARVNAMARAISEQAYPDRSRFGLIAHNSAEYLVCYLGILRAGHVVVPIGYKFPRATVSFICGDSGVRHIFADNAAQPLCPTGTGLTLIEDLDDFLDPGSFESAVPEAGQTALILYTSGSTGRPKGVVLSHESQWAIIEGMSPPAIRSAFEGRNGIVAAPLFHMNGLAFCEIMLFLGGTTVLLPRFDTESFVRALERHEVHVITGVPTMLSLIAQRRDLLATVDLSSVEMVWVGSAPLSDLLIAQARKIFPGAAVLNGYGTTETGAGTFGPHPDGLERPALSIGHPMPHAEMRLVEGPDADQGVLEIRSPSNMTRYQNLPEVTAQKMTNGWINTGDIMRRDPEGFFYFVGRADDMFVCSGENVYPGELERVLERHPDLIEICVVPYPDEVRGQIPVAFVVRRRGSTVTPEDVKAHALTHLAPYMHPRHVFFLDQMPLAGTNKIDRRALSIEASTRISP